MQQKNFESLLSPLPVQEFLSRNWEKQFVHIKRDDATYFDHLLTLKEVDQYLFSNCNLSISPFKFYLGKQEAQQESWSSNQTYNGQCGRVLDHEKVLALFQQGYSLYLNYPDRIFPKISEFCLSLESSLQARTISHLIIAPANTKGFLPHTDPYGVFVLQIVGNKTWSLFEKDTDYSLPYGRDMHQYINQKPVHVCRLKPGDLLYIPRGLVHSVSTDDEYSIHISLGLIPPKGVNLIGKIEELAASSSFFREYIPFGFLNDELEMKEYSDRFKEELKGIIEQMDIKDLLKESIRKNKIQPKQRQLSRLIKAQQINGSTLVRTTPGLSFNIIENQAQGNCHVVYMGKSLSFPVQWKPKLEEVLNAQAIDVGNFGSTFHLNEDEQIQVVKNMLNAGLLELANS